MEKLISLSKITDGMDSVEASKFSEGRRAFDILFEAQTHWNNMARFRKDRMRNKRYAYGDQWKDIINVDGKNKTEEEYIKDNGNIPLKNNLIRRLVRNVVGVYINQDKEPICVARDRDEQKMGETMSTVLQYNMQLNRMGKVNRRTTEEFLISGLVCHKKWFGWQRDKLDVWTSVVQADNLFVDTNMRDYRGWDIGIIGEVHDISFNDVCTSFAKSPKDYARLKQLYLAAADRRTLSAKLSDFGYHNLSNVDFLFTSDPTRCRVIEVWKKERKPRYRCHDYQSGDLFKVNEEDYQELVVNVNEQRRQMGLSAGMSEDEIPYISSEWFMDSYWYYYYLTPFGDILDEGETPYEHGEHPYVFDVYPFIDGEIHSFVADVIDQQRYTNRLITMYDWIMRASAKGVLLYPDELLPDGMTIDDIADEWSRFNGIILFKPKPGVPMPQQISNKAVNIGISELLNIQLKFFEDISGVNGALQGKPGYSSTSGALYAQQTQNATTSLLDIMEDLSDFAVDGAYKTVKCIQQFYDEKRYFNISGRNSIVVYDPDKIKDIEFDMSIVESQSTPTRRDAANQILLEFWKAGAVSLQQVLEVGHFDFADELLQSINSQQEQLEQGQTPSGVSPELMQQVQAQANPQAVQMLQGALRP